MARLLEHSDALFSLTQTRNRRRCCLILYRCAHLAIAKRGMTLVWRFTSR
jgi:hypothetical protein